MRSLIKLYHRASRREDWSGEASIRAWPVDDVLTIHTLIINNHLHICDTVARLQYNLGAPGLSLYRPIIVPSSSHCLPFLSPLPSPVTIQPDPSAELSITWINGSRLTAWLLRVYPPIKMCSLEISTIAPPTIAIVSRHAPPPFCFRMNRFPLNKC